ncbi:MAG: hypothetical protein Q7T16_01110 [Candidatus Burarchaeum sp.]|nr:hypothetical protein [Candidatus Burarchaeum sp.]
MGKGRKGQKRDWKPGEQKLVRRGEMLIPIGMAGQWKKELWKQTEGFRRKRVYGGEANTARMFRCLSFCQPHHKSEVVHVITGM